MAQQSRVGSKWTTVRRTREGVISVVYHQTEVVRADADTITLDTGGYFTHTTKSRMNQASNQYGLGYAVYQKDHKWYVRWNETGTSFPFMGDSITIGKRNGEWRLIAA